MCPNKKPELQASTSRAPDLGLYMQANFLTYTTDEVEDNTVDNVVLFVMEEGEESATEEVVDCASPGVEDTFSPVQAGGFVPSNREQQQKHCFGGLCLSDYCGGKRLDQELCSVSTTRK